MVRLRRLIAALAPLVTAAFFTSAAFAQEAPPASQKSSLKSDAGFGLFAPFSTGVAGFEIFPGGRIFADFRAAYRWQWDAPDRYQFRIGISLAVNSDWWDGRSGGP